MQMPQHAPTEYVTIAEAARRLGVSPDTIKRRLKRGELVGRKQSSTRGMLWQIEVPALAEPVHDDALPLHDDAPHAVHDGAPAPAEPVQDDTIHALRGMLMTLERELDARRRETERLLGIIEQMQRALPLPVQDAPPAPPLPVQDAPYGTAPGVPVQDRVQVVAVAAAPRRWWRFFR